MLRNSGHSDDVILQPGDSTGCAIFFEAVVGAASPLVRKALKEAEFRGRYGGAVVAIHRAGERVNAKLGEVALRHIDTLLHPRRPPVPRSLERPPRFPAPVAPGRQPAVSTRQAWIVGALGLGIVFVAGAGLLPVLHASLIAAIALVVFGIATAAKIDADARLFAIAMAVAASASFLTPIGYQTNTMVYGPGGYQFGDYARLGIPSTLVAVAMLVGVLGWL